MINEDLLFDCGEGTTQKLLQVDVIDKIRIICLTHLHNDHFVGIFSLLWHYWIGKRTDDLLIIGPKGTEDSIRKILALINTPEDMMKSFDINYIEIERTDEVQSIDCKYDITYISVDHKINSFAYRLEVEGKSFCYTGDTRPIQTIDKIAKECDLFVCEATLPDEMTDFAHEHFHCTPSDSAELAISANCKKLVLIHISSFFLDQIAKFKSQAQRKFERDVIIAEDLMVLEI